MATSVLTDTVKDPAGNVVATSSGTVVNFRLMANGSPTPGFRISDNVNVASLLVTSASTTGVISQALENNANITPTGTYYLAEILCPSSQGGTQEWALLSSSSASPQSFKEALAATIPAFTPITTVPASVLASINIFTATNNFRGNVFFGSGSPWVDVREELYGATGNGVTDDTAAVQAAINALGAGGICFFPPGTYICSTLTVPSGVMLLGAHRLASIIKQKPATSGNLIANSDSVGGNTDISVLHLTIDGNKANQTSPDHAVAFDRVTRGTVMFCIIKNAKVVGGTGGDGVRLGTICLDCKILYNDIITCGRNGVSIVSGSRNHVVGNTIDTPGLIGIDIEPNLDTDTCSENKVTDNAIISPANRGIFVEGGNSSPGHTALVNDNIVANNTITDAGNSGIEVDLNGDYTKLTGNTVLRSQLYGIIVSSPRLVINTNEVVNNSQSGAGVYPGIYLNSVRESVVGNVAVDTQGSPTQSYGILESTSGGDSAVVGNSLKANLTGGLLLSGTVSGSTSVSAANST